LKNKKKKKKEEEEEDVMFKECLPPFPPDSSVFQFPV
jgi:hypothetical protein